MIPDRNQKRAVTYKLENLLVVAGPGSGKTAVLTQRIRYLIRNGLAKEKNILVLTFTRAAAEEMKLRYLRLSNSSDTDVNFGTFHSVFLRMLKEHSDLKHNRLISEAEAHFFLKEIFKKENNSDLKSPEYEEKILSDIARLKNGRKPHCMESALYYGQYRQLCKINGCFDYDDILLNFYQLLIDKPVILMECRKKYPVILVDEFQDINRIQYEILKLLSGKTGCIFAVGDDDQSIYGFRGSDPGYMKMALHDFPSCGKVVLERNYRSTGAIVAASGRLINHNKNRIRKHLKSNRRKGIVPEIKGFHNLSEEARYIADKIRCYDLAAADSGLPELKYAVLARTNRAVDAIRSFISDDLSDKIEFRTFHSSKGLEYDAVFISQANEEVTPGKRSDRETLEEERRAFYVAVTRCRTYLHIFYTKNQYNNLETEFIAELSGLFKGVFYG